MDDNTFEWDISTNENLNDGISFQKTLSDEYKNIILNGNTDDLKSFLEKEAHGKNIKILNDSLASLLQSNEYDYFNFWGLVDTLLNFDAPLFMTTICKNIKSYMAVPSCPKEKFSNIVKNAFSKSDKIKYAIHLIRYSADLLTYEHKNYILSKCLQTTNSKILQLAFEVLNMPAPFVVQYLRSDFSNEVLLYTLYNYYHKAIVNKIINKDTVVEVYSYPYINMMLQDMMAYGERARDIAFILEYELGFTQKCKKKELFNLIKKEGQKGYNDYYASILKDTKKQQNINSLKLYSTIYKFKVVGELKYYIILYSDDTSMYALLPKNLSKNNSNPITQARIFKIDFKNNVLYVYQEPLPHDYQIPPVLEIGEYVEVSFTKRGNSIIPVLRKHTKILRICVKNSSQIKLYKLRYKAVVKKKIKDFYYLVQVVDFI